MNRHDNKEAIKIIKEDMMITKQLVSMVMALSALPILTAQSYYAQKPIAYDSASVHLEVGYFVSLDKLDAILVEQTDATSFQGCASTYVTSNLPIVFYTTTTATSEAGGKWHTEITPESVPSGVNKIDVCVEGTNVDISKLPGGQQVKVAEIRIEIMARS